MVRIEYSFIVPTIVAALIASAKLASLLESTTLFAKPTTGKPNSTC